MMELSLIVTLLAHSRSTAAVYVATIKGTSLRQRRTDAPDVYTLILADAEAEAAAAARLRYHAAASQARDIFPHQLLSATT